MQQQRSTFTASRFSDEARSDDFPNAERSAAPRATRVTDPTRSPERPYSDRPAPERPTSDRPSHDRPSYDRQPSDRTGHDRATTPRAIKPAAGRSQHSKRNRNANSASAVGFTYRPASHTSAPAASSSVDPAAYVDQSSYVDDALSRADTVPHGFMKISAVDVAVVPATSGNANESAPRRTGAHRLPAPPVALKGRVVVLAVAAGALVAAGQATLNGPSKTESDSSVALAAGSAPAAALATTPGVLEAASRPAAASASQVPQILNVSNPTDLSSFGDLLAKGQKFSEDRAAQEMAKLRPLFVLPATGIFTSNFGTRWGTLHAGVDIANKIGTPIYAVADGVVIDSGPAAGFGLWVRLQHADGTITVYGHIDTTLVTMGEHVMAGDQIATLGNRGESTGPHLHFEVHLPGEVKIDPLPWLATRGISLGIERD